MTTETAIGEIARIMPAYARVFETLDLDYCCGGKASLAQACRAKGLDAATVVAMLAALDHTANGPPIDPATLSLSKLCDHIQQVHHVYLRKELPRLDSMTRRVAAVHGDRDARLLELRRTLKAFKTDMTEHTDLEDQIVFPAIRRLKSTGNTNPSVPADFPASFEKLQRDHDDAAATLGRFKILTDNYRPPDWACNTLRSLCSALARLEKDMHEHVHKENNILFPKALSVAARKSRKRRRSIQLLVPRDINFPAIHAPTQGGPADKVASLKRRVQTAGAAAN